MTLKMPNIPPELLEKNRPQQQRAIQTYERILTAAAELLEEVGVERISTNLIAARANITVPALYRYFSNKYAVLYALGARLMDCQNDVLVEWHDAYFDPSQPTQLLSKVELLVRRTYEVTNEHQAGWSVHAAMRAIPVLQEIRLQSHKTMATWLTSRWKKYFHIEDNARLESQTRLAMELVTAGVAMAIEDPEMPPELAISEASRMMELYWSDLFERMELVELPTESKEN